MLLIIPFILLFITSCEPLNFSAQTSPIEELRNMVTLEESIQFAEFVRLFYFNENLNTDFNNEFPLDSLFPIDPITHYTGTKYGNYKETIRFDFSQCITKTVCNINYIVIYPEKSEFKKREIVITVDRKNTTTGKDDKILFIYDKQKLSSGYEKDISVYSYNDGKIVFKDTTQFGDLFPIKNASIYAEFTYPIQITSLSSPQLIKKEEELRSGKKIIIIDNRNFNNRSYIIENTWSIEVTTGTELQFKKQDNGFSFKVNNEFSSDLITGIFKDKSFIFNIKYPDSIISNRVFSGHTEHGFLFWEDNVIFNDSSSQTIKGRWGNYSIKVTTAGLSGWLNIYENNWIRKIAGSLFSYYGELSLNEIEHFYFFKNTSYQWDNYYTERTIPDEIADITFISFFEGNGTISIFDGNTQKSHSLYVDFWQGTIK